MSESYAEQVRKLRETVASMHTLLSVTCEELDKARDANKELRTELDRTRENSSPSR